MMLTAAEAATTTRMLTNGNGQSNLATATSNCLPLAVWGLGPHLIQCFLGPKSPLKQDLDPFSRFALLRLVSDLDTDTPRYGIIDLNRPHRI